jgi:hypothetical protein
MFCVPILVFGCSEGVGSHFHVLRSRTRFRQCVGRRVLFSCFALPDSFLAVPRVSGPVFMFGVPVLIFGGSEGIGSHFHVLCSRHVFSGMEGVGTRFYVLCSRTRFWRCEGRWVPFSCFALLDSFSSFLRASGLVFMFCVHILVCGGTRVPFSCFALPDLFSTVLRVSGPVFMFCVPVLVFGGSDGVGSRFHVLRSRTRFR